MQSQPETQSLSPADLQLIELYFDPQLTTHDIAARLDMPLLEVLAALERPDISACIERLAALSVRRARDISLALLPDNIERLQRIGETSKNEEISRKAISAVMRFSLRREAPGRAAEPRPPRQDGQLADHGEPTLTGDAACEPGNNSTQDHSFAHARREAQPSSSTVLADKTNPTDELRNPAARSSRASPTCPGPNNVASGSRNTVQ
jgi:hypothetical protein